MTALVVVPECLKGTADVISIKGHLDRGSASDSLAAELKSDQSKCPSAVSHPALFRSLVAYRATGVLSVPSADGSQNQATRQTYVDGPLSLEASPDFLEKYLITFPGAA
ncbi:MAG: hypothetical protein AUH33_05620 [Chloroflexi bacterium 13_1_40CM_68_21]|nr:MAG: hypothetical protein AUH33_05620 [Chloroflexi bacterium 13_1_40CM_68_21]